MGSPRKRRKKNGKKINEHKFLISFIFLLSYWQFEKWREKTQNTNNLKIPRCISCFSTHMRYIYTYIDFFVVIRIWDASNYSSNRSRCMAGNSRSSSKWAGPSRKNISWPDSLYQRNRADGRSNISWYLANPGFLLLHKRYDKQKTKITPHITRNNNNKKNLITYM